MHMIPGPVPSTKLAKLSPGMQLPNLPVMCLAIILVIATPLGFPRHTALATIRMVPDEYPTIQHAIDASAPGDTTVINTETVPVTSTIQVNKPNLVITGLGRDPLPLVYWSSVSGTEIFRVSASGCTIAGLHLAAVISQPAALFINAGTTGTSVIGNHFDGLGVNLIRNWGDDFLLKDNFFDGCLDGVRLESGSAIVDNNTFESCGRGIVVRSSGIISNNQIRRCGLCDNGCNVQGAGIHAYNITGELTISGNLLEENWSSGYQGDDWDAWGGGILLDNCQNVTIDSNILRGNQAKLGAALFATNSSFEATYNVFTDNYDESNWPDNPDNGYGSIAYLSNCSATVFGNTFAANSSSAGSAFHAEATTLEFGNNILSHTVSSSPALYCVGEGSADFSCNVFWENEGGVSGGGCQVPIGTGGNLLADPMYCNISTRNLSLRSDSPCATENAPPGCGQIGALPVDCEVGSSPNSAASFASAAHAYPNPSSELPILLLARDSAPPVTMQVYDAAGRAVTGTASVRDLEGPLRLTELFPGASIDPGTYFIRITDGANLRQAVKFTVVR